MDPNHLGRTVVKGKKLRLADQHATAGPDLIRKFDLGSDHPFRRNTVGLLREDPHEIDTPTGDDPSGKTVRLEIPEEFDHRLINHRRIGPARNRMFCVPKPRFRGRRERRGGGSRMRYK